MLLYKHPNCRIYKELRRALPLLMKIVKIIPIPLRKMAVLAFAARK
jgi:hypothetical protein